MKNKKQRPSKDETFLDMALVAKKQSTCVRRNFGAVIVKDGDVISTGYNGPARGAPNCMDHGCLKDEVGAAPGRNYDVCRAGPLHAEVNSIINAARHNGGIRGATMYIAGTYFKDGRLSDAYPCIICKKQIVNAGLKKVVIKKADGKIESFDVEDWVAEAKTSKDRDIVSFYN